MKEKVTMMIEPGDVKRLVQPAAGLILALLISSAVWSKDIAEADKTGGEIHYYGNYTRQEVIEMYNRSVGRGDELPDYGNTPDELRPFRSFVRRPYKYFFVTPLIFTGPGRDLPEPEVETVKIGVLAPVHGMMTHEAYIGSTMVRGIQLAVEEANDDGGYKGKPFEVVLRNDAGLWGASANEIVDFSYEDKVWGVIGSIDGANTHIAIRVALKTEIPVVNVGDTDPTLVETKIPWIFRTITDDRQMCYTIAWRVYKELGLKKVAILRANNRYGRFGIGEFKAASERLLRPAPIEINYDLNYDKIDIDFAMQVERLKKVKPQAIILWADAEPGGYLVRAIRRAGIDAPIYGCDRLIHGEFLRAAGEYAEGVITVSPYNPDLDQPKLVAFKGRFQERWKAEPGTYAVHGYDGACMMIEAIRQSGLNRYRIRDGLARMRQFDGAAGEINMDAVYAHRGRATLATIKDGKYVFGLPELPEIFKDL
ncbi:ABC transporter substrate-binding protein [candidate division KSB1 bacterium]